MGDESPALRGSSFILESLIEMGLPVLFVTSLVMAGKSS